MNEIKKTVVEEGRGVTGFLIPEQVMPSKLVDFFGLNTTFKMTVTGSMVEINSDVFFKVENWQLARK